MQKTGREQLAELATEDRLFNFRPLFFFALFLCLGIVFAYFHIFYSLSFWCLTALLPFAAAPFFFCRSIAKAKRIGAAFLALVFAFSIGYGTFRAQINTYKDARLYQGEYTLGGRVVEKYRYDYAFGVLLDRISIDGREEDGKLVAYLPAHFEDEVRLCDEVVLKGKVKTKMSTTGEYGFAANDIDEDIRYTVEADECLVVGRDFGLFLWLRERIEKVVYAGMDKESASFTTAIITGDTSGIDKGVLENARRGGIAHIFAVSGLHVGALYAFCLWICSTARMRKKPKLVRFILLASVLLFYGGICGYSASVVRATVLCLVFYASSLLGISSDSTDNLGLAAVIILLISPVDLFTVGFQLSFTACLGIVWLARPIKDLIYGTGKKLRALFSAILLLKNGKTTHGEVDVMETTGRTGTIGTIGATGIADAMDKAQIRGLEAQGRNGHPPTVGQRIIRACVSFLSVTLAAQIATAPLIAHAFGYISVWALLLNCIFVPIISAAFSCLLLVIVLACLLPIAWSGVILFIPSSLLGIIVFFFEVLDFSAAIEGLRFSGGAFLIYYLGLTFCSDKWNLKKVYKIPLAVFCFLLFAVTVYALNA